MPYDSSRQSRKAVCIDSCEDDHTSALVRNTCLRPIIREVALLNPLEKNNIEHVVSVNHFNKQYDRKKQVYNIALPVEIGCNSD